ncbi:MAG: hypothetical protein H6765_05665 [Candidatus Peribacteria bacterium]|nr:MAG: hypothetical protein H6765_05665 [Candidatus Peribacteria bacterium]
MQAIPAIVEKFPHFHAILNIIPSKRDHDILHLIQELGIQDHLLLLHGLQIQQLVSVVSAADFAVVPSLSE